MKIVKSENGKKTVKISKSEWEEIGKRARWIQVAQYSDSGLPDDTNISQRDDFSRQVQNDLFMSILSTIKGNMDQNALMELEIKLQELSEWIVNNLRDQILDAY